MVLKIPLPVAASFLLHGAAIFTIVTLLRAPEVQVREDLPLVQILTLVRPPEAPVVKPPTSAPKQRISRPLPQPDPVNPVPAVEPAAEPVVEPPAPEPVTEVAATEPPSGLVSPVPAAQQPSDPVYPAGRLKDGLVPLVRTEVPYPLIAQDRGIEGSVDVQFVVGKSGAVEDVWIGHSSHKIFSEAVMKNVRKWRFKPPVVDGRAARVRASQHFEFNLE